MITNNRNINYNRWRYIKRRMTLKVKTRFNEGNICGNKIAVKRMRETLTAFL